MFPTSYSPCYPGYQRVFMRGSRFRSSLKKWPAPLYWYLILWKNFRQTVYTLSKRVMSKSLSNFKAVTFRVKNVVSFCFKKLLHFALKSCYILRQKMLISGLYYILRPQHVPSKIASPLPLPSWFLNPPQSSNWSKRWHTHLRLENVLVTWVTEPGVPSTPNLVRPIISFSLRPHEAWEGRSKPCTDVLCSFFD